MRMNLISCLIFTLLVITGCATPDRVLCTQLEKELNLIKNRIDLLKAPYKLPLVDGLESMNWFQLNLQYDEARKQYENLSCDIDLLVHSRDNLSESITISR